MRLCVFPYVIGSLLLLSACGGGGSGSGGTGSSSSSSDEADLTQAEAVGELDSLTANFSEGGDWQGTALTGQFVDEFGFKVGVRYAESLTTEMAEYNANPDGESGGFNCLLSLTAAPSLDEAELDTQGCLPLEVVNDAPQAQALKKAALTGAPAQKQDFTCVESTEDGVTCTTTSEGFTLEGPVDSVSCDDGTALTRLSENGRASVWGLSAEQAAAFGSDFTLEDCTAYAFADSAAGNPLEGVISGQFVLEDATAPVIELGELSFTQTLTDDTPRDIGQVCLSATATDAIDGEVAVALTLTDSEATLEQTDPEQVEGESCFALDDFSGLEAYVAATAEDSSGNRASANSAVFSVDANNAPECQQSSTPTYNADSGEQDLTTVLSCTDPEGDDMTYGNATLNTDGLTDDGSQTVSVSDGQSNATFDVDYRIDTPEPANADPVVSQQPVNIGTSIGQAIDINNASGVACTDSDGDSLTYSNSINGSGSYTPEGEPRMETFTVTCSDGQGGSATSQEATLYICPEGFVWDGNTGCE